MYVDGVWHFLDFISTDYPDIDELIQKIIVNVSPDV